MTCYLHIGTEKTATTTLQNFFNMNRNTLLKKGFLYTKSAGETNNVGLPLSVYSIDRRDELTSLHKMYSDEDFVSYQRLTQSKIRDEVEQYSPKSLIFSSEHIHSRLISKNEIYKLKEFLLDLGVKEFNIIVYLRDPSQLATSLYSTSIKYGSVAKSPPHPGENAYYDNICNHKKTLETFAEIFGMDALTPRLFSKNEYIGGTIIHDFMHLLGLPLEKELVIPVNQNASLSNKGLKMMRIFNIFMPVLIKGKFNRFRNPILKHFETYFVSDNSNKFTISDELSEEYDKEYSSSNEWVRTKFFPHKKKLF